MRSSLGTKNASRLTQELWKRLLKYLAEHDIAAGADKAAVLDIDGKPNEVLVAA